MPTLSYPWYRCHPWLTTSGGYSVTKLVLTRFLIRMTKLHGITWDHTRGLLPMVATAQRFGELHPEVEIVWEKRSLQEFADRPIQDLAESFDLLVIDHPFVGYAAAHPVLLPLDEHLPAGFLADQAANSVGQSHASYFYGGHQWALAIDAATPVAAWRPDLISAPPRTWDALLALARQGRVAVPGVAVDCLMHAMMLCQSAEPTEAALVQLRELYALCPVRCFEWNPIRVFEALCAQDELAYCPFAYGYSNYARDGYARRRLQFGDVVDGICTTLGGTGLAISRRCRHLEAALAYAQYVAGAECQQTLYWQSGGQPGHRAAWLDAEANRATHDYFCNTLPALDRAWLRPRHDGYLHFQDAAGPIVREFLQGTRELHDTLCTLKTIA